MRSKNYIDVLQNFHPDDEERLQRIPFDSAAEVCKAYLEAKRFWLTHDRAAVEIANKHDTYIFSTNVIAMIRCVTDGNESINVKSEAGHIKMEVKIDPEALRNDPMVKAPAKPRTKRKGKKS